MNTRQIKLAVAGALALALAVVVATTAGLSRPGDGDPRHLSTATTKSAGDSGSPAAADAAGAGHDSMHATPPQMRTLVVQAGAEPEPSRPGAVMHGLVSAGAAPSRTTVATVLTDENCAPDAQGVSHCTNKMRLTGGRKLTVTHPHRMAEVPCMTPGEKVKVVTRA